MLLIIFKLRKENVTLASNPKISQLQIKNYVTAADKKNGNTAKVKRSGRRKHVDDAEIKRFKAAERKRKQR